MKLFYPYFNLFRKKDTSDYHLEVLVKMPGNCYKTGIEQSFDGEYWEVRIKLAENKSDIESKVKLEEFDIKLTPNNPDALEKIKIIVKNYDNTLRNGESDGEGKTGSSNGEVEP